MQGNKHRYRITYENARGKAVSVIRYGEDAVEAAERYMDGVGWWGFSVSLVSADRGARGQEWATGYFSRRGPHKDIYAEIVREEPPCC